MRNSAFPFNNEKIPYLDASKEDLIHLNKVFSMHKWDLFALHLLSS